MKKFLLAFVLVLLPTLAFAQNNSRNPCVYPNTGSLNCVPVTPSTPLPVVTSSQYPTGVTPIQGNGAGTTGAVVGTLAGASGKTTYICDFDVSAVGGTAPVGPIVIAGLLGGSKTYQLNSAAIPVNLTKTFNPCLPASSTNTAITITTTANGTATAVNVNSSGFQQ